jgi:hypothetical protein
MLSSFSLTVSFNCSILFRKSSFSASRTKLCYFVDNNSLVSFSLARSLGDSSSSGGVITLLEGICYIYGVEVMSLILAR